MKKIVMMLVILSGTVAQASVESINANLDKCLESAVANNEMKQCTFEAYDAADKELNAVYKSAVANLKKAAATEKKEDPQGFAYSAEILKRLVASERAWITYRDTTCNLESTEMLFGSGEGLIYAGCMSRMTLERVTFIDKEFNTKAAK